MVLRSSIIAALDAATIAARNAKIPEFSAGDTLKVAVRVQEGDKARIQMFEGVCIARHNKAAGSSFTVRKLSFGEGVELVFPLYGPNVDSITVLRRGAVRRAKLYYLRGLTGKAARITERARKMGLGLAAPAVMVPGAELLDAEAPTA